ncbi:hypothetical protein BIY24_08460 [Halobacteriovorax marinus]|uniref:ferritin-like domain-containing protein n=1 Tax=Halobacteriovorax marinus TaxID=97084 RepID=UPI000BC3117E|nr:ferritin-like domain-containing protein [Halobacteriovorax marinus]ATH07981.1 hypothetical protein BIY24_08460 [Halobacteriovorax marinus]
MSKSLDVSVYMNNLHQRSNESLKRILKTRYKQRGEFLTTGVFWNEEAFDLQNVEVFKNLSIEEQSLLLTQNSSDRVEEAYHIEKSGIAYGAKMTLLSENLEERLLYGTFTGDEARHFQLVSKYINNTNLTPECNPFLQLLAQMIETAPKKSLVFMIQVLLEGWGMDHYNTMAKSCLNESLKEDLSSILADEASHHGSGLILFNESELSREDLEYVRVSLETFFSMVQCGPLSVYSRLISSVDSLSRSNKRDILSQMNAMETTQRKLDQLSALMKKSGAHTLLGEMESSGKLKSFDIDQMLSIA